MGFEKGGNVVVLGGATIAGFFASACSLPFDYVKTQMQKMKPDANGVLPYSSSVDCAVKVGRKCVGLGGRLGGRCVEAPHAAARPMLPPPRGSRCASSTSHACPLPSAPTSPRRCATMGRSSSTLASPLTACALPRTQPSRSSLCPGCPAWRPTSASEWHQRFCSVLSGVGGVRTLPASVRLAAACAWTYRARPRSTLWLFCPCPSAPHSPFLSSYRADQVERNGFRTYCACLVGGIAAGRDAGQEKN